MSGEQDREARLEALCRAYYEPLGWDMDDLDADDLRGCMKTMGPVDDLVADLIAQAEQRGRVEALREAADRMPAFHDRDVPEWAITSACRWLRDRADREEQVR